MEKIFKTKFGSHLYGTDTPNSDLDYKGIFKAPLSDIILGRESSTIFENEKSKRDDGRNNPDAVDCEWIELRRFIKDCLAGQTYALDMLFAPVNMWQPMELFITKPWSEIISNRSKLLSKDVKPYIGYCRHQATKYGLKGSRLGELIRVIEWLNTLPQGDLLSEHIDELSTSEFAWVEEKTFKSQLKDVEQKFLVILDKRYPVNAPVKKMLESLNILREKYGCRAIEAMNNENIDWKAVSHAYRCMYQLAELAETGEIKFPLKDAEKLKAIKLGQIPWKDCNDELYQLMENTIKEVENSKVLPDKPDYKFWDEWIIKQYIS
jgi:hypothetical protein